MPKKKVISKGRKAAISFGKYLKAAKQPKNKRRFALTRKHK